MLRDQGLEPALRALADQTAGSHGDRASTLELGRGRRRSATTASIALYTILRELRRAGDPARAADATIAVTVCRDRRRRRSSPRSPTTPSPSGAGARSRRSRSAPASSTATRRGRSLAEAERDPRDAARAHRAALSAARPPHALRSHVSDENGRPRGYAALRLVAGRLPRCASSTASRRRSGASSTTTATGSSSQDRRLPAPRRPRAAAPTPPAGTSRREPTRDRGASVLDVVLGRVGVDERVDGGEALARRRS